MDTKTFHLGGQPAPEGILTGVSSEGEFHAPARCDAYFVSYEKVNTGTDTDAVAGFGLDLIYHKNPGYKPKKPEYMP